MIEHEGKRGMHLFKYVYAFPLVSNKTRRNAFASPRLFCRHGVTGPHTTFGWMSGSLARLGDVRFTPRWLGRAQARTRASCRATTPSSQPWQVLCPLAIGEHIPRPGGFWLLSALHAAARSICSSASGLFMTLSQVQTCLTSKGMTDWLRNETGLNRTREVVPPGFLSCYSSIRLEVFIKSIESLGKFSRCSCWDSHWEPPKYKSEASTLEESHLVYRVIRRLLKAGYFAAFSWRSLLIWLLSFCPVIKFESMNGYS